MRLSDHIGRGIVTLFIGFLLGTFVGAFVSMVATSAGTELPNAWLGAIGLAIMVFGLYPIHRLVWNRSSETLAAETADTMVGYSGTERET
jgi:hypothetical protein